MENNYFDATTLKGRRHMKYDKALYDYVTVVLYYCSYIIIIVMNFAAGSLVSDPALLYGCNFSFVD